MASQADNRIALLLDVGNTRIKAGWCDLHNGKREPGMLATPHAELDTLISWLRAQPAMVSCTLGTNVAGTAVASRLQNALSQAGYPPVQWITGNDYAQALGIINSYHQPRQLGADRWVAMVGLANNRGLTPFFKNGVRPLLLASFGTATTVDVLCPPTTTAEEGASCWQFAGGLILPGVELMRQALATQTADLPAAHGAAVDFPQDTHRAIATGIAAAQAGAVLRQWQATIRQCHNAPEVFTTGGNWPVIAGELQAQLNAARQQQGLDPQTIEQLETPVLDGLARIAQVLDQSVSSP